MLQPNMGVERVQLVEPILQRVLPLAIREFWSDRNLPPRSFSIRRIV
jgi:hypothetical protein